MSDDTINPLLAILPIGKEVTINRGKVLVTGVSWNFIGALLQRHPKLAVELADNMLQIGTALNAVPESIPAFLAAGIDKEGDKEAERILGRLPAHQQVDLIGEVVLATMGGERDFFVEKLKATARLLGFGDVVDREAPEPVKLKGVRAAAA